MSEFLDIINKNTEKHKPSFVVMPAVVRKNPNIMQTVCVCVCALLSASRFHVYSYAGFDSDVSSLFISALLIVYCRAAGRTSVWCKGIVDNDVADVLRLHWALLFLGWVYFLASIGTAHHSQYCSVV